METISMTGNDATDLTTNSNDIDRQTISVVQLALPSQNQNSIDNQSVIHTTPSQLRTIQIANVDGDLIKVTQVPGQEGDVDDDEDIESRKRRELLARRPSYRKIFNDISSPTITVTKIEEESDSDRDDDINMTSNSINTSQVLANSRITLPVDSGAGSPNAGLQTLTMTNASVSSSSESGTSPTIVQYTQSADGQFYIPAGSVQAYQISTPTSLPQTVVMAAGSTLPSPAHLSEEATRKRELRLLKNRDAAKECRRKKKEYVKCLENRVAVLENQNKTLIDELKALKELYCQKEG